MTLKVLHAERMSKAVENRIADLIEDAVYAAGYELVRVQILSGGKYATLQVMAEPLSGGGMTVEDCAKLSRLVSAKVEAEEDLAERYALEVSSPGIDRPLVKRKDFERYKGHIAKIELNAPFHGQRRFQGVVSGLSGDDVLALQTDKGVVDLPFENIDRAKLVLTDALLKKEQEK